MANANINFNVTGTDKTGAAFNAIGWRAKQLSSMLKGALAFAGAYFGFRAIKGGIDELGHLSDIAQKTSTSVDELTQAAGAMGALGIQNMGVDQLAKAFDYMAKTTGKTGMAGFYETIGELGKIEDVATRGQEAMKVFGRSGMELMPLINAADTSVEALKTVQAALPKIPQSAANAGDAMSDAMGFAANQAKSIWLQGLGAICGWFDNEYKGGVREASLQAGNYMEYYAKVYTAKVLTWYKKIQEWLKRYGDFWGTLIGAKMGGASWSEALSMATDAYDEAAEEYEKVADELEKKEQARTERFKRDFDDRAIAIGKFKKAYDDATESIKDRQKRDGLDDSSVGGKLPTVKNELIMAGSNDARKLQILGPQLQSETKKQTGLLQKIADNTKSTADNTEHDADNPQGVIDRW